MILSFQKIIKKQHTLTLLEILFTDNEFDHSEVTVFSNATHVRVQIFYGFNHQEYGKRIESCRDL